MFICKICVWIKSGNIFLAQAVYHYILGLCLYIIISWGYISLIYNYILLYHYNTGSNLGPLKSETILAIARHRCCIYSKEVVFPAGVKRRRWAPPTSYTLRRKTASMMKDFFDLQISASASKPE